MSARQLVSLICVFLTYTWAAPLVNGQTYSPGPAPTFGGIMTECVEELPLPRDRTTVGIGEEVKCWIDPATWEDVDYQLPDPYNPGGSVYDEMGDVTWSVTGPADIYPTTTAPGEKTTLTVQLVEVEAPINIIATVVDAALFAQDQPQQKAAQKAPKIPTGIDVLTATDVPDPQWVAGQNKLGAQTFFLVQVKPNTVNFGWCPAIVAKCGFPRVFEPSV